MSGFFIDENAASLADKLTELLHAPERMRRVGQTAQDTIYISWEDSVARAAARYETVIDNYRAGKYPAHTRPSDSAYRALSGYLAAVNRLHDEAKTLRDRFL